jgi:hypothetical protein
MPPLARTQRLVTGYGRPRPDICDLNSIRLQASEEPCNHRHRGVRLSPELRYRRGGGRDDRRARVEIPEDAWIVGKSRPFSPSCRRGWLG